MRKSIESELAFMEHRLNGLRMSPSERVDTLAAMRKGLLFVEGLAWLGRTVMRMWAFFSPARALRPEHRHG